MANALAVVRLQRLQRLHGFASQFNKGKLGTRRPMERLLRTVGAMRQSAKPAVCTSITAFLCFILGGCASSGKDFVRPDLDSFVLGQTTAGDVISRQGAPTSRVVRHSLNPAPSRPAGELPVAFRPASVPGTIETLTYRYSYSAAPGLLLGPMKTASKQLALSFWNDRLVLYNFTSSFSAETANFNESSVQSFVPGQWTKSDVIRALGRPNGEAVYPLVAQNGTRMLSYDSINTSASGLTPGTTESVTTTRIVRFLFDSSDRLLEVYRQTVFSGS
jgi:hypothetical protein